MALFLLPLMCFAQQQTASLTGQVTDTTGAAVPGAQVTVSDPERGVKTTVLTDERGNYLFPQLEPSDHYEIVVTKTGF
jgi:protocatechuate 3,4-dioxygenase beta subunit